MKKRVFCIVLLLVVAAGSLAWARYDEISSITASLSFSGNVANVAGSVVPQRSGVNSSVTVRLQKWNGSGWDTKATWYGTGTTAIGATASGTKIIDGGTYRTWVTGTCGKETAHKYSAEKNY